MNSKCLVSAMLCLLAANTVQGEEDGQPLRFTISRKTEGSSATSLGDIWGTFKNVSEGDVRLLKLPDSSNSLRFWFSMVVANTNGTPVLDTPVGGKISLRGLQEYILIKPQESYHFRLDHSRLMPELPSGVFHIKVIYRNQYGEDCFCGILESNSIDVEIR